MKATLLKATFLLALLGFFYSAWAQGQSVTFSVMADIPYGSTEATVLQQHVAEHNLYSPSEFMVHLGDIKSGSGSCSQSVYTDMAGYMKEMRVPTYIIPGDNEYNDCSNPSQAWGYWEDNLMAFEQNFCGVPSTLERQSVRPENFAFTLNGVLLIGLNLVGGSVHDQSEWDTRMQQDADWVSQHFLEKGPQVRAAVVFGHAGPGGSRDLFFDQFEQSAIVFGKPVLYMHGDGHSWVNDNPFSALNITRVEVDDGGSTVLPVQVTVDMDPLNPFSFERDPWTSSSQPYNMPPCVEAGSNQSIMLPAVAVLEGEATDDGDPPSTLTVTWSVVSGPGSVSFANPQAQSTTASFQNVGTYVLRLTADDSQLQKHDELTVQVSSLGPALSINDITVNEGNAGTVDAVFTVSLAAGNGQDVSVDYASANGSAISSDDYSSATGTLNFSGSTTTQTITVQVNGDLLDEPDENFFVNLSNASNASITDGQGQGTITDDDLPPPPVISSFSPTSGPEGTEVTITGSGFTGASSVKFNGTPAAVFTVASPTQILANVPSGATTGKITVTTAAGIATSAEDFTVTLPPPPTISSFSPSDGLVGTEVTINGADFTNASSVKFNGTSASSFTVTSSTQILATVPTGATTGKISVTTAGGTASSANDFIVNAAPMTFQPSDDAYVKSTSPTSNYGTASTLRQRQSSSETQYTYLKFNVSGLSGTVQSTKLRLYVTDASNDGGSVYVVSNNQLGTTTPWTQANLIWNNAPAVSGTALSSAGAVVISTWIELDVTAAFGGDGTYSFGLKSTSSDVVYYSSKEGSNDPELVIQTGSGAPLPPTITSFTPTSGLVGAEVTINGSRFTGASSVNFNGTPAAGFTVDLSTKILANVPSGATTGKISVTTGNGAGESADDFTVTPPPSPPTIASFTPTNGLVGSEVTINGSDFTGASSVKFNGASATSFTVTSATEIRATVPTDATTGKISVTTGNGTAESVDDFTVTLPPPPTISSFSPSDGLVGTQVTINGTDFTNASSVKFNGTSAGSFTVNSSTQILATVPTGATTGKISVTTAGGTASSADDFTVVAGPTTFLPSDDAYVKSTSPTKNYGTATTLRQRQTTSETQNTYLKFTVSGLSGAVQSAKLRLYVTDASNDGGSVYVVSNNQLGTTTPWTQANLTWNNAPAISGTALSSAGAVVISTWIELDVTAAFGGDGTYSFGLKSTSSDVVYYSSKEGSNDPELVIQTGSGAPQPPSIASFTPSSGLVGAEVTINGSHFTGASSVQFNGTPAAVFTVASSTQILANVPTGATTGKISVTTGNGTAESAADFSVTLPPPAPTIASFTPTDGLVGMEVTIAGSYFTNVSNVKFNGTAAVIFAADSDMQIRANVPSGATTGKISVTTVGGTATSADDFTVNIGSGSTTASFQPVQDAYVKSSSPTSNFGSSTSLRVRTSTTETIYSYLKFDVAGLTGAVQSAKLKLYVDDDSDDGGSIFSVSNNYLDGSAAWIESGIVWDNSPLLSGSALSALGVVTIGSTVELDVTAAITGNGVYSFGLKSGSGNLVKYNSRQGANPPALVVETVVAAASGSSPAQAHSQGAIDEVAAPERIALYPVYPNPFNPSTTINFAMPEAGNVTLRIYSLTGQLVKTLVDGKMRAGRHNVSWNGRDQAGAVVASGIYFYQLVAQKESGEAAFTQVRRMVLVK